MLRTVLATRYVTALREGGSLPGLMEADDLGTYVVKFHGAGQGRKALIAEVICARLARELGLPVPDLVTVELDTALAAGEPDEEVQALLRASGGRNLGVDFLPGALDFDPAAFAVDAEFAGRVLWFDALINNVDRSWRNPNMLLWHGRPYLIDHGSTLTFHHTWKAPAESAARAYDAGDHVLIGAAPDIVAADTALGPRLTDEVRAATVADVPDEWLADEPGFESPGDVRRGYLDWFAARLAARPAWLDALRAAVAAGPTPRTPRERPRFEWLGDTP
ncbi:MAG TPA: HipA family kinase [Jatrophihabitantaceae bacterium]|jgi:hypothetical protein